jgi:hypothetical protein
MMSVLRLPLLLAATLCLSAWACATTPVPSSDELTGCYYFERGIAADTLHLPWGVQLLPDTLEGWPAIQQLPGVRRALTLVGPAQTAGHPFGYWRPLGADSVEIGYPAGGGLVLALVVEAGAMQLTGTARAVGDAVRPGAPAAVARPGITLGRAACP